MTILNYSGRGGGGDSIRGGGGRGRGGRFAGRGQGIGMPYWAARGREHPGRSSFVRQQTKWVRPKDQNHSKASEPQTTPSTLSLGGSSVPGNEKGQQHISMRKRGRNQLISRAAKSAESIAVGTEKRRNTGGGAQRNEYLQMYRESDPEKTDGMNSKNHTNVDRSTIDSNEDDNKKPELHADHTRDEEPVEVSQGYDERSAETMSKQPVVAALQKLGRHKLVLPKAILNTSFEGSVSNQTSSKRPPMPPSNRSDRPVAQRIKLTGQTKHLEDAYKVDERQKDKEKLSHFTYRETSRKPQRGHHKTWRVGEDSSKSVIPSSFGGVRNMGLVRANDPNASICLTFLKGMNCENKFCRERHDVPKESVIPVCSFFQRNGQCLKADCQFRHVKVNPRAMICPSFASLGYCEDGDCAMKHTRSSKFPPKTARKRTGNGNRKYARHI